MNALLRQRIDSGSTFRVKVIPKSSRTGIIGELSDGTLKIRVASAPERGKANAELCAYLAREAGVPQSAVEVVTGQTSPLKLVRISRHS